MSDSMANPYLGPRTFEERHAHLFFGRDREARDLLATVISEPLVLFYAPSGAGKSSLINTRLIPGLREEGFYVLPVGRIGGTRSYEGLPADNIFVHNLLASISQGQIVEGDLPYTSLTTFIRLTRETMQDPGQPLVLIVDQFEELVTSYHGFWHQRDSFFDQLNQALEADSLLWIVLSLREDYLAAIEPYARALPGRLLAHFQMQRMRAPAALDAISQPAADHQRPFAEGVATRLVDNLRQIRTHEAEGQRLGEFVEPVQLQVVCYQLWENLKSRPLGEITAADVDELGDVDQALGDFYQRTIREVLVECQLTELELRTWFEHKLITEDNTRGTVYQGPEETAGLPNEAVRQLADRYLLRSELRAGGAWYELVHDRLVSPILQSNAAWREAQGPLLAAAETWRQAKDDPALLLEGNLLREALAVLDPSTTQPLVMDFLSASQVEQEHRAQERNRKLAEAEAEAARQKQRADEQARTSRRLRLLSVGLLFVFLLALGLGIFAASQAREADRQRREANRQSEKAEEVSNALSTQVAANSALATAAASDDLEAAATARAIAEAAATSVANAEAELAAARATVMANTRESGAGATEMVAEATSTPTATATATAAAVVSEVAEQPVSQESAMPIILNVPYKSQLADDASDHDSDDGPAALAMLLSAAGREVAVDRIYDSWPPKDPDDSVRVSELMQAASNNGLDLEYMTEEGVDQAMTLLRDSVDNGQPFIALVKYEPWQAITGSNYRSGHYVVVVGYDEENIYVHDSLLGTAQEPTGGAFLQLPNELFVAGWGGFSAGEGTNWSGIYPRLPLAAAFDLGRLDFERLGLSVARLIATGANLLPVPYRSQWAQDARSHRADGGVTDVAMLLNASGTDITPDQLFEYMRPIAENEPPRVADMIEAAESNGMELEHVKYSNAQQARRQLQTLIDEGKPFIALAKYEPWRAATGSTYGDGAWVLVVGYDEESVYVHDPLFAQATPPATGGAYFRWSWDLFLDGWGGFDAGENDNWQAIYPTEQVTFPPS